ncbi:hypothetical protein SELMODRAFT_409239 [Selaginella moellendorffii]|uniref:Uncharacterized protein n=1 Tax=Selaginella moellendorffii TaxID=88036 RepID=D8RAT9_SELML|nr:hypothetical protein SELMODRAFT_409239 [Selaginella moellendorffii]
MAWCLIRIPFGKSLFLTEIEYLDLTAAVTPLRAPRMEMAPSLSSGTRNMIGGSQLKSIMDISRGRGHGVLHERDVLRVEGLYVLQLPRVLGTGDDLEHGDCFLRHEDSERLATGRACPCNLHLQHVALG